MALTHPPTLINYYLSEKIADSLSSRFASSLRFFPTQPTDIQQLTENFPEASGDVFAVYDRMFKYRRRPFPHIKSEQLLYYFYKMAGDPEALIETTQAVYDLLDRGDESAQDINAWIASKADPDTKTITFVGKEFLPVYFHNLRVYQLEETRDIIDFGTARTYAGNKVIIDYEYHPIGYSEGNTMYGNTSL
jgi:hypothetical protein